MDIFEVAGNVAGTALRFGPTEDGRLAMTVLHRGVGRRDSVILRQEWLRPLAAWFAGQLSCELPFGTAWVTVSVRRGTSSLEVALSAGARQDVATWLRRADAQLHVARG
jgi:hypothetical protein